MFAFIAQKLMEGDVQFFRDKIVEERIAFYVEVRVGYDFSRSLGHSLDLGTSPRFYRVDPSQLSASQQAYLRDNKRKLDKEPPKLCSFHQQDTVLVDFVDCLLYFILNHSVIVLDVLTIVQYKCADFMYNYMQMLQDKRSKTTSDIESKMVKALGGFQLSLSTLLFFLIIVIVIVIVRELCQWETSSKNFFVLRHSHLHFKNAILAVFATQQFLGLPLSFGHVLSHLTG